MIFPPDSPLLRLHVSRLGLAILALAFLGVPISGCDEANDDDDSADEEDEYTADLSSAPVRVSPVHRGSISQAVESSSTVTAERSLTLRTESTGTVRSLEADDGDTVERGRLLARLDNPAAEAEARRTRQDKERAEQDADALQGLFGQGFLSRREYDETLGRLDAARTADDVARQALRQTEVRAPFPGTISRRYLQLGAVVSTGQDAFDLVDLERLRIEVSLPERELARLQEGLPVQITSEFQGAQAVEGTVSRLSPVIDPANGTFRVRIDLDPEQNVLRPGMFVNVRILVDTHENALLVDKRCLFYERGQPQLFVVREDKATLVRPELGFTSPEEVEILSGVEEGESVVMHGQSALSEGANVEIVGSSEDEETAEPVSETE